MNVNVQTWASSRVLVTGPTGMIGSWLCKSLVGAGADVTAFVLDQDPRTEFYRSGTCLHTNVVNGRLERYEDLMRAITVHEPEAVIHLGAQTLVGAAHAAPLYTMEANVRGTYNLLEACRVNSHIVRRIVVASSDKAYGPQAPPFTEDMPLEGRHPYEVSKSAADLITQAYHHTYGLPVVLARCGNVYGGGDLNWSRIVPSTIRALLHDRRPVLRSDGTNVRDYVYVEDIVSAYLLAAARACNAGVKGEAFNFSDEKPLTVLDMVSTIQQLMGKEHVKPEILGTAKGEIADQHLRAQKARERLGWQPAYSLDQGLSCTIDWYRGFFGR